MKNGNLFLLFFYRGYIVLKLGDIILGISRFLRNISTFGHLGGASMDKPLLLDATFEFSSYYPFIFQNTFLPCPVLLMVGQKDHLCGKKLF
jgi:hypothetical protein